MSDLKEVISLIRSCLLTSKGGTPIENLNRDYKSLEGENIPHRRLGFPNLNDLLNQVPGLRVFKRGDSFFVEAIATAETAHIASMVAKQKSKSKKKRRPLQRYTINSRRPNISTNTHSKSWQQLSSLPRNTSSNQRANLKSGNLPSRNINNQQSKRQSPTKSPPVNTNSSKIPEQQKFVTLHNDNRTKNSTSTISNVSSPPVVNREINGKSVLQVSPPLPTSSQPSQQPRTNIKERLVRPPPLPNPNSGRTARENTNIDRRVTFAPPEVRNMPPRIQPLVAPLPTISNTKTQPPSSQSSPELKDPRDELLYLVKTLKLGMPEYKIFQHSKQNKINAKLCSVTVGSKKYSSYPAEAKTEDEAEKLAAVQAVLDIHKSYGPLVQLQVTNDVETIKQRIIAIVDVHNGVLIEQLPVYYKENHNETLPNDWIRIVDDCPNDLTLEKNNVNNSFILWRYNAIIHKIKEPQVARFNDVPASLVLPIENLWPIRVQNVVDVSEIWAVILEDNYNTRLVSMTAEMSKSTAVPIDPAKFIEVGRFYIIKDDQNWFRVRVENVNTITNQADIFFIDTGDYDTVSYENLYPLDKRFCELPPQAIRLSLAGLEEFSDSDKALNLAEELLSYQHFYASVNSRDGSDNDLIVTVTLYDTSGDDDVDVNDLLLRKLFNSKKEDKLNTEGRVTEVVISNVELNGNIYVQLKTDGLKIIAASINRIISPSLDVESFKKAAVVDNIDTTEIYLAKCPDGNWLRSKIIEILGGRKLKMLLIDFGRILIVDSTKLLRLRPLSSVLENYPQQAHKVQLHNIEKLNFNERMMNRLLELAPLNERLLCKVIKATNVPIVELFKRSQPDNVLISINNTLALIPEIDRNIEDGNNNIKPKKRLDRTLSRCSSNDNNGLRSLRKPEIPPIGDYFDVHVTNLAANPSNFIVQPYSDITILASMMMELQNSCNEYTGPMLTEDMLREGKLCAAKYNDGWYRACINGIIDAQTVVVYLCDYGDMTPIGIEHLQPLMKKFTELPYQGIKARLYGVEPMNVDWTPLTCTMFQDLVANKNFPSVVREIEKDNTSPTECIISLELIDVSTNVDIKIHEKLVNEKKAKLTVSE